MERADAYMWKDLNESMSIIYKSVQDMDKYTYVYVCMYGLCTCIYVCVRQYIYMSKMEPDFTHRNPGKPQYHNHGCKPLWQAYACGLDGSDLKGALGVKSMYFDHFV